MEASTSLADQVIKVLDYVLSSPLLIGVAVAFGIFFVIVLCLVLKVFSRVFKTHDAISKSMSGRHDRFGQ